jgi:tetratricopeptide (TPR) repeat protein
VRRLLLISLLSIGACQAAGVDSPESAAVRGPTPEVAVVARLPAGTRVYASAANQLSEAPRWRAARTWWREALAQTATLSMARRASPGVAQIELRADPERGALTAHLRRGEDYEVLASVACDLQGSDATLRSAIDHLAWSARLALGEPAARPMPVHLITSADYRVVAAVEDAAALSETGAFGEAYDALRAARRRDGGAPFVLAPLAALELLRGDASRARDVSREAVRYPARCSPTTQHRLARTLLMANAALNPSRARASDVELERLSRVARGERPYDDEPLYTAALACNFLAKFEAARPLLEELHERSPERAFVSYHLGWACLGCGDAEAAASHLTDAARRLPTPWLLLPLCVALFDAGMHDALTAALSAANRDQDARGVLTHQILRIQAAHALLGGRHEEARACLIADLRHLVEHPLELAQRSGDFAEAGAVLVRLGSAPELPSLVAAVQKLSVDAATKDAAAFVGGMEQIARTGRRARGLEGALSRDADSAWGVLLTAFAHEREGEVGAMQTSLARAARLSSSPMTKALLAKSLRAVGKTVEADRLRDTLRREMMTLNLRARCLHPIFGPELAYAFTLR